MDFVLVITVLGIAALDSINPSAILVTFWLLPRRNYAQAVTAYVAGIFLTYLALGIILLSGFSKISSITDTSNNLAFLIAELCIGIGLFVYSFFIKPGRNDLILKRLESRTNLLALFMLGSLVTVIEFTTALPYIGAIGVLAGANINIYQQLSLLLVYNLIFIMPPLIIMCVYMLLGESVKRHFTRWKNTIEKRGNNAWPWIVGIIGFLIARDAVVQLLLYFKVITLA